MNLTNKTFFALLNLVVVSSSQAIVFYDIDQATVSSDGVETVLTSSGTEVHEPLGDEDLVSYRITSGAYAGTTLSVEDYISGVSATSSVVNVAGYIQPSGYVESDFDFEESSPFYTGSSDPISYSVMLQITTAQISSNFWTPMVWRSYRSNMILGPI